jgi:hypothetical protein
VNEYDERIARIVKAVAKGPLDHDDCAAWCVYCEEHEGGVSDTVDIPILRHKSDCEVVTARQLLIEWGMPLNVYLVEYEHNYMTSLQGRHWKAHKEYLLASSTEEVIQACTWSNTRNIQAIFVRELPREH